MSARQIAEPSNKKSYFFHPILLGAYPILALMASNLEQARLGVVVRPLFVSLVFAVIIYGILRLITRNWGFAALLTSLVLFLFYSYGHVYGLIEGAKLLGIEVGRHRFLLILWGLLLVGGTVGIIRIRNNTQGLNRIINMVSLVLVIISTVQIVYFEANYYSPKHTSVLAASGSSDQGSPSTAAAVSDQPDVYYIILDSYTRDDMLKQYYGYDNQPFIDEMTKLGFVFPECTQSNYGITPLSLPSSLNMDYLGQIGFDMTEDRLDHPLAGELVKHSQVRKNFEELGYKIVAFETGVWWTEMDDADLFIQSTGNSLQSVHSWQTVDGFEDLLFRTTLVRVITEGQSAYLKTLNKDLETPEETLYRRVNFVFDQMEELSLLPERKFVFVHLMAPHAPFVFGPDGEYKFPQDSGEGYINGIKFINNRVIEFVKTAQKQSSTPPIIIIQGDHGIDNEDRMQILNTYYLPGKSDLVYSSITPVNTFRLIFNQYFGYHMDMLKDVSYYSRYGGNYFNFTVNPPTCSR